MNPLVVLIAIPLFLIAGCMYLALLIAAGCGAVLFARRARLRVTLLRRARVPDDGGPLTAAESYLFAGIARGWKQQAPEPQYQDEGEL